MTKQEKVLKIMSLAMEISGVEEHYRTGDYRPLVWVEFFPHIPQITVGINMYGWAPMVDSGRRYLSVYLYQDCDDELDGIINELEGIKEALPT